MPEVGNFVNVAKQIVKLVRAQQMEKARRMVDEALRVNQIFEFSETQGQISAVNLAIFDLKRKRKEIVDSIQQFPELVQFDVRHQIDSIIFESFDQELRRLRVQKRRMSRGRARETG